MTISESCLVQAKIEGGREREKLDERKNVTKNNEMNCLLLQTFFL